MTDGTRHRGGHCRVGLDIGGTFTDLVLVDDAGGLRLHKLLTTPDAPEEGALRGVRELLDAHGASLAGCDVLVHGTTLVTNAVIERRGVPTALLATRGFRDILEIGREQRYDTAPSCATDLRRMSPLCVLRARQIAEWRHSAEWEVRAAPGRRNDGQ